MDFAQTKDSRSSSSPKSRTHHRKEVADRSSQHKHMPDRVPEAHVVEGEEKNPEGVEQASREEQNQSQRRQGGKELAHGDQRQPAHGEIKYGRSAGETP